MFDESYYLKTYPEVKDLNINPITHYIKYGWKEGKNPSEKFDTNFYLESYKDVKDSNINPLFHYIKSGRKEKRKPNPNIEILTLSDKIKNKIKAVLKRYPFIKKIFLKLISIKNFINFYRSSSQNKLALDELTNRRFDFANKYFNKEKIAIPKELPEIDISVVTYNSSKWIENFFKSLVEQKYPLNKINLFFIDNSSKDDTVRILEYYKLEKMNNLKSFSIISQDNLGFGAGHDRTFKEGKSDFCLVTNIDLEFEENSIVNILEAALADEKEEYASWEFRQIPYEHPKYYDPITLETNWSSHACILIRKSAYEKVGGYEPKIFMYAEDVELSYRFRAYGYHLKYCPDAVVYHFTYEEANQIKPLQYQGSILGNAYLRLRYGNKIDKLVIFPLFLSLFIKKELFKDSRKMIIKNFFRILKNRKYFLSFLAPSSNFYAPFRGFDYEKIRDGAFHEIKLPKNKPLVSVIVRTYRNRNELLKQALISIINQTYKNIEIIVVEDGGNTMKDIVSQIVNNVNIKYFALDKVERSATGNYGLSQSSGEYCIFLDDDDLFFADHIEVLVETLEKNPKASASYSLAFEVPTTFLDEKKETYIEENGYTPELFKQIFDYEVLQHHNYFPIQTVLFKRSLFLERGGFDESLVYLEDWNLWLRYAYKNHFEYVSKTTSLYRVPANKEIAEGRTSLLEKAYNDAKEKSFNSIRINNEKNN